MTASDSPQPESAQPEPPKPTPSTLRSDVRDVTNSPESERETEALQADQAGSPAFDDPAVDADQVLTLPGTGGPDDVGDIEVDPDDLHMPYNTGPEATTPPKGAV